MRKPTFEGGVNVASWTAVELLTDMPYTYWYAPYWNITVRLSMFLLFCVGLWFLRKQVEFEEALAKTDPLTGVLNRRCFCELADVEMKRAARYQRWFTIVYIDLDGFKSVNDELGHEAGDNVLRTVAHTIRANLRASDFVSRLGGDEFIVLLAETGPESAVRYLEKMRRQLLDAMKAHAWKVTFSIGAMTYLRLPTSVDELIGRADALMYEVKRNGKDGIKHQVLRNDDKTICRDRKTSIA